MWQMVRQASTMSIGYLVITLGAFVSLVHAQIWSNYPRTVYACPGDDVTLPWNYIPSIARDVTMIQWRHVNTSKTVAVHHLVPWDKFVVYHGQYQGRVVSMEPTTANAGLMIKQVTSKDGGTYKVSLIGTVFSNTANLNVIDDSELDTLLLVDGEVLQPSTVVYKPGSDSLHLSVSTYPFLKASVLITTKDQNYNCIESTVCNVTVPLGPDESHLTVTVAVYYGICQPREHTVYIQTAEGTVTDEVPSRIPPVPHPKRRLSKGAMAGIIIAIILVVLLVAAITIWILFYRKKSKGYVLKPWQRKYVDCKVFVPFKKSKCFKDSKSMRSRSRSKNSSTIDHEAGSSVRDLDREFRTLTKEDITVVYDDSPGEKLRPHDESSFEKEEENDYQDDSDYEYDDDVDSKSNRLSKFSEA